MRMPSAYHVPMNAADVSGQCSAQAVAARPQYDGSVIAERTKGELSARCDKEEANFLALNLANDIATGKKTVAEARQYYARAVSDLMAGKKDPYVQKLQFSPQRRTADADRPAPMRRVTLTSPAALRGQDDRPHFDPTAAGFHVREPLQRSVPGELHPGSVRGALQIHLVQQYEETSAAERRELDGDTVLRTFLARCGEGEHQALRALDLDVLASHLDDGIVAASSDREPAADARVELRPYDGGRVSGKQKAGETLRPEPRSEDALG
jgi:hypothetical protein